MRSSARQLKRTAHVSTALFVAPCPVGSASRADFPPRRPFDRRARSGAVHAPRRRPRSCMASDAAAAAATSAAEATAASQTQHSPVATRKAGGSGEAQPHSPDDTLYLIDAMGLLYRSYHALSQVTFSSIALADTRAVYGFTLGLCTLLTKYAHGARVAVVFEGRPEGPGPPQVDFRTAVFPEYKANRAPTPEGVRSAVPWVKKIVRALGCSVVEVGCFEADDVIGTLVHGWRQKARSRCVIVSSDKDFRQLLSAGVLPESSPSSPRTGVVEILRPVNRSKQGSSGYDVVDEAAFRGEFGGIAPRAYVDVLCLIGDHADNVPGVPGIGAKTAPKLIADYGGLESLLEAVAGASGAAISSVTKRQAKLLTDNAELARLSRSLVTIREDVDMQGFEWKHLDRSDVNVEEVTELCRQLEFQDRLYQKMLDVDLALRGPVVQNASQGLRKVSRVEDKGTLLPDEKGSPPKERRDGLPSAGSERDDRPGPVALDYHELAISDPESLERVAFATSSLQSDCLGLDETGRASNSLGIALVQSHGEEYADGVVAGIAVSAKPGVAWYFALGKEGQFPAELLCLLRDASVEKCGWSLKEAAKLLHSHGLAGPLIDLRIACDLLWSGQNITDAAFVSRQMGSGILNLPGLFAGDTKLLGISTTPAAALAAADVAGRLGSSMCKELASAGLTYLAYDVEFPLTPVLAEMEMNGVPFSSQGIAVIESRVDDEIAQLEEKLTSLLPQNFQTTQSNVDDGVLSNDPDVVESDNAQDAAIGVVAKQDVLTGKSKKHQPKKAKKFSLSSRDDVANLLFDTWAIPVKSKTPTGRPATNKKSLSDIAQNEDLPENQRLFASLMLKHREVSKLASTYTRSLAASIAADGRIRSTFMQEASASGRLSTSSPNLQAIPVRSNLGRCIRETVAARPGYSIISADYSQIELRILAALSGDSAMIAAFAANEDIHAAVASRIFGTDSPTPAQRSSAKAVSFGIPYGISAYGLAQQLSISVSDARALIKGFFAAYPGVKALTQHLVECARDIGYAATIDGRRLYLPLLTKGGAVERRAAERVAVNMPIQGTQADMIKAAMVAVWRRLKTIGGGDSVLVLQVHDELIVEAANDCIADVMRCVCEEMCQSLTLPGDIDVVVNAGVGRNWLEASSRSKRYESKGSGAEHELVAQNFVG